MNSVNCLRVKKIECQEWGVMKLGMSYLFCVFI